MPRAALLAVLTALLFIGAPGCGSKRDEAKPAAKRGPDTLTTAATTAKRSAKTGARVDDKVVAQTEAKPSTQANHVRLRQRGCIEFEPHWTTIRVGQSLTWHSDLKVPVTIHVPAGAFDRMEYVVRAGQTVSTGPAHSRGTYPMWTTPAACQGIARGVQGSGPGVTVEGAPVR
jgi:plastocyanin